MGVEAARRAVRGAPNAEVRSVWFSTVAPAYLDKTNATTVHAALRLGRNTAAYDVVGSVRSGLGALRAALGSVGPSLVVSADARHRPAGWSRRSDGRRRRGCPARWGRCRRAGARRARDLAVVHRGVPRPVAHAGRRAFEGVGGTLRRDAVHEPGGRGVGGRAEGRRSRRRPDRPPRRDEHASARRRCGDEEARCRARARRRRARRDRRQHGCRAPGADVVSRARGGPAQPDDRARRAGRRRRRDHPPHHGRDRRPRVDRAGGPTGRRRCTDHVRQVPRVAWSVAGRTAAPAGTCRVRRRRPPAARSTGSTASSDPKATTVSCTCRLPRRTTSRARWPTRPAPS